MDFKFVLSSIFSSKKGSIDQNDLKLYRHCYNTIWLYTGPCAGFACGGV